jgi:hypothetical protein
MPSPTVEALEAEETEEEKNIDELDSALEASETTGEEDASEAEPAGEEPPTEVVEGEPEETPVEEPEAGAEEVPEEEKEPTKEELLEQQNKELRQILREQKKAMTILEAKVGRVETGLKDTMLEDEKELPALSDVEQLQAGIAQIGQEKGTLFETLVEAMEAKPEYADIRQVCSREHFDDIFEEVGKAVAIKEGIDPTVAALALEAEIWQMDNPYKYMYEIIKEHHPTYAKEESEKEEPEKKKAAEPEKKEPEPAPTSIASVGGSDAAEDELDKVPNEVYQQYLRGELN